MSERLAGPFGSRRSTVIRFADPRIADVNHVVGARGLAEPALLHHFAGRSKNWDAMMDAFEKIASQGNRLVISSLCDFVLRDPSHDGMVDPAFTCQISCYSLPSQPRSWPLRPVFGTIPEHGVVSTSSITMKPRSIRRCVGSGLELLCFVLVLVKHSHMC